MLPSPDEYAELAPRRGSLVWRRFNDVRMLSTAGYATLLQVAHPTVGAGVHQYSSFTKDPWGRLLRTLDYVHGTVSGGPELAGEIGRRVRELHRTIKGVKPDGERYHAMEPDAFAWVHATLAHGIVAGSERFARPLDEREKEEFWREWLGVGRLVGVRPQDLPERWADFPDYFEAMVDEELEWTEAVPEVLEMIAGPPPPLPLLHPGTWRVASAPMSLQLRIATAGLLPPRLRERLGMELSARDAVTFRAMAAASRAAEPLVRGPLREFGPHYLRWRREALERGDVAGHAPRPRDAVAA